MKKGINSNEISYNHRLNITKDSAYNFMQYDIVLLSFIKFGPINKDTYSLFYKYILQMPKDVFEKECRRNYQAFNKIYEENKEEIVKNPLSTGYILSSQFIVDNYRYVLGTILAMYARKNAKFSDVVNLNNHINEYENQLVSDVCLSIGININEQQFLNKCFKAIKEDIENNQKLINKKIH